MSQFWHPAVEVDAVRALDFQGYVAFQQITDVCHNAGILQYLHREQLVGLRSQTSLATFRRKKAFSEEARCGNRRKLELRSADFGAGRDPSSRAWQRRPRFEPSQ